ncbi:uncharacterized protein LOC6597826 [Drosophila persimilis]|uniref:uncharacterized protein LOC6597826 n=1 Tax=Drosophila persimilis TaxID=7234 RepID=UPI000F0903EB|nr:uncharacterized protein LOC6597826 [Drosophila persimilis]XP_026846560.1 uncharacterized protein LOC6597826 [Drosophila persimilis]XP_026846561.1 uncharacterized protein LOC6597826 [Drosophila persimilis]
MSISTIRIPSLTRSQPAHRLDIEFTVTHPGLIVFVVAKFTFKAMSRKRELLQAAVVKQSQPPTFGSFHKQAELMKMLPLVPNLREIYNMFDPSKSTGISEADLGYCLHAMGLAPTHSWLKDNLPPMGRRWLSFEKVLTLYCKLAVADGQPKMGDVLEALRAWDVKKTGKIAYSELRKMLTTMGDPIDETHVFGVLASVSDIEGNVHYEDLVANMHIHDAKAAETLRQARNYLQALGRNAVDMDMTKRDEFIDDLRRADPQGKGYIGSSKLLELLNRSGSSFTAKELDIIIDSIKCNARSDKGIDYRRFLRYIMDT